MQDSRQYQSLNADKSAAPSRYRQWLLSSVSIAVFVVALVAIRHLLAAVTVADLLAEIKRLSAAELGLAMLFTAASFVTLVGYDWSALRYLKRSLPFYTVAFGSLCGCAVANAVGWNFFSGASVRYRIYTSAGLSAGDVARVALFGSVAYGTSICVVGAAALVLAPDLMAGMFGLKPGALSLIGWSFLVWLGLVFLLSLTKRQLGIGRFRMRLPDAGLMAIQLLIAILDMVFTAACLYVLVPHHTELPFLSFLAASSISIAAGIVSQVPGGLGVFEGAILYSFRHTLAPESLAAALRAYRLIYTLLPLLLAVALLALREVTDRIPAAVRRAD